VCVVRVGSMAEAMQLIDDHEYGNGICIVTRDGEATRYFSDNIKVGIGAGRLPPLLRLEALRVRLQRHVRPRQRQLLHPPQNQPSPSAWQSARRR